LTAALAHEALSGRQESVALHNQVHAFGAKLSLASTSLAQCNASLASSGQEMTALRSQNKLLRQEVDRQAAALQEETQHRDKETRRADYYQTLHHQARLKVERRRKQASRYRKKRPVALEKAKDDAKQFRLKSKGMWKPVVRTGFARLRAHGVSAKKMDKILKITAKMFGGEVQDNVSERTVGRSTHEVGIIGQLQLMHEIKHAEC
jgi:hypothetical protein